MKVIFFALAIAAVMAVPFLSKAEAPINIWRGSFPVVCTQDLGRWLEYQTKTELEAVSHHGMSNDGSLLQVWKTVDGKAWTVTVLHPKSKVLCIIAAGVDFESVIWLLQNGESL